MKTFEEWLYEKLISEGYLPDEARNRINSAKWILTELKSYNDWVENEVFTLGLDKYLTQKEKE